MAKVVYFGKHISDKIRDANRVFSEILISPFIVRNERKIRHQTYDEFVDIKKRVIIGLINVLINYNLLIVFVELIYLKFTLLTII